MPYAILEGDATTVLEPSEMPETTGQSVLLAGNEKDIPAEGKQEVMEDTALDRPKDPEATPAKGNYPRERPRRIFAAVWSVVKRLLLCGCCRWKSNPHFHLA